MVIARGMDRGRGCYKGLEGVLGGHGTVPYPDWDGGYTNVCVCSNSELYTKKGEFYCIEVMQ